MEKDEAVNALKDVILEIDKGNEGIFNNGYCVNADMLWSKGRETTEKWNGYKAHLDRMPFKTYEEFCGVRTQYRIIKCGERGNERR